MSYTGPMYIAPGLVYLHIPRTGGTFVSQVLHRHELGTMQLASGATGHEGIRAIPEHLAETSLVFATVRDPWSWYFSIDAHYRHKGRLDGFLHEIFGKTVPFKEVLRHLTCAHELPTAQTAKGIRYPGARVPEELFLRRLGESGLGLWSWMVLRTLCRDPIELVPQIAQHLEQGDALWSVDVVIDTAQLRDGLCSVIGAWQPETLPRIEPDIRNQPSANKKGGHRGVQPNGDPDPSHYDPEMQGWVARADSWMIRRLGFDQPIGQRPPIQVLSHSA